MKKKLPLSFQFYFPSWNLKSLDWQKDRRLIITQILNYGDQRAIRWLLRTYPQKIIKQVLLSPLRGVWDKKRLNYWLTIFGLKLRPKQRQLAIREIDPYRWQNFIRKS